MKKIHCIIFILIFNISFSQKTNEIKIIVENNTCIKCACDFFKNDMLVATKKTDLNGLVILNDTVYNQFTHLKINLGNAASCTINKNTNLNDNIYICNQNNIDLKSNTLEEVAIYAKKSIIEDEGYKLTYNVDKELVKTAVNSSDLLRKTPMVSLDINGTPSIRGNSSVLIMVNDKPIVGLLPSQIIEQIPANQISKIEVITNPSSKYDAEGTAGIINIVTKTKINFKSSGYLNIGLGTTGSHLFANYIYALNNKWTISNYFNSLIYYPKSESFQTFTNQNSSFNRISNGKSEGQIYGYQLSIARSTEKSKMNFNFNYYTQNENNLERYKTNFVDNIYESNIIEKYSFLKLMTDYENKITDKLKINSSALFSYIPLNNYATIDALNVVSNSFIYNTMFSIDVENKITKKITSGIGTKINANFYKSSSSNFAFEAKQSLLALYTDNKFKINNTININLGLRFEEYSLNDYETIAVKYGNVFLNNSLNIKLNNKTSLSFLYGQRTQRPSYSSILPIQSYTSSNQVGIGNPNLNPEISNNYEVGFSKHLGNNFIKISPYYKYIKNRISNFIIVDNNYFNTNYINLSSEKNIGASLWVTLNLFKQKLSFNYGLDIIEKRLKYKNLYNNGIQYLNNLNLSYKITQTLTCNLFGNFNSPNIYLQGKENAFNYSNFSLQKEFNKENMKLAVSVDNPFNRGFKYTQEYVFDNYSYNNEITYLNRGIRVFFIYKFGNKDASKETNKDNNNDNILKQESIN